ncbi:MAG: aminotransferase class III-fold pyridoxal phosphate-dependent enzyme [Parcubacteria group bacterium]|nr:aminotransferase class III-fold pyridoxal phosphate-dependent enzyme [Parcubacteria group bacterium]
MFAAKKNSFSISQSAVFHRRLDYRYPFITHGKGIYLYDENGNKYIDAVGGALVANIGHGIKEIAQKIGAHLKKITYLHASQFTTRDMEEYAKALIKIAPKGLRKVYFTLGGSDAVETAMKLARQYHYDRGDKKKYKVIFTVPGYHGATFGALSVTPKQSFRKIFKPYLLKFPSVPASFCYHCPYQKKYPSCHIQCARELETVIRKNNPETIAAFIVEPILGASAGAVVPPQEYFDIIQKICKKHNILLIADEVMSGFGRTGKWFACEHLNVRPDILIAGKGISSGFVPLSAVFCTQRIFDAIRNGSGAFVHGFTYVNNQTTTKIGKIVLEYIQKNQLVDQCALKGKYLLKKLQGLEKFQIVGDIRGKGLMTAIEFVKDKKTKMPFERTLHVAERVIQIAQKNGLILYFCIGFVDGVNGDAIMVAPPFTVKKNEIDRIVAIIAQTIKLIEKSLKID